MLLGIAYVETQTWGVLFFFDFEEDALKEALLTNE